MKQWREFSPNQVRSNRKNKIGNVKNGFLSYDWESFLFRKVQPFLPFHSIYKVKGGEEDGRGDDYGYKASFSL